MRGQRIIAGAKASLADCHTGLTPAPNPAIGCLSALSGLTQVMQGFALAFDGCVYVGAYQATGGAIQLFLTLAPIRAGHGLTGTRTGTVAANAGDDVVRALTATERKTLDDALRPEKLDHVFDPKHHFDSLVRHFGSREAAMEHIVRSIGGALPQSGPFQIVRSVGGQDVIIRGAVVEGIPRIGTAFTP